MQGPRRAEIRRNGFGRQLNCGAQAQIIGRGDVIWDGILHSQQMERNWFGPYYWPIIRLKVAQPKEWPISRVPFFADF